MHGDVLVVRIFFLQILVFYLYFCELRFGSYEFYNFKYFLQLLTVGPIFQFFFLGNPYEIVNNLTDGAVLTSSCDVSQWRRRQRCRARGRGAAHAREAVTARIRERRRRRAGRAARRTIW